MKRPLTSACWLVFLVCALGGAPPVAAQTTDDLFNSGALRRLDLFVNSIDWEKLKANFQVNDYYPADVQWEGMTVRNVGIRSRGGGSRSGIKPGLRVDFDRYASDQKFLGLKALILDNFTQDASGLRERVAMRLFERMGLPAPREAHVVLFVNNEYAGLYAVVEEIDKDFLARVFGRNATGVENDGYLFEYQWVTDWYFNYPGDNLDTYASLFDPVTHEKAPAAELYSTLEVMLREINYSSDQDFVPAVSRYLDLPLFMKHVAVQNFLAEIDGILGYAGLNNFYLYRFEGSQRSQFIAWDEDHAFWMAEFPVLYQHDSNVLMRRAMNVPELRAAYFAALQAAADSAAGWLEQEVQQQRALVTDWMFADPVKPYSNDQFQADVDALVAFAQRRPGIVRCEVARFTNPEAAPAVCGEAQAARARRGR
jgi:hypothetical protein